MASSASTPGWESILDGIRLLEFHQSLDHHGPTDRIFATGEDLLRERGRLLEKATVGRASTLSAPPSTENQGKALGH